MAFERMGRLPLDHQPVHYGPSRLLFRGPRRRLTAGYVACLGGTQTYGRFVEHPFPDLLERALGVPCANFGCPHAGVDLLLGEAGLLTLARAARAVVLQVPPAVMLCNPFYHVHPRRNDRVTGISQRLRRLYPEVDFTEFHFVRHLLLRLQRTSPERFEVLRRSLQDVWVDRMETLLERIERPVVLLWFADHSPGAGGEVEDTGREPAFVSRDMLRAIGSRSACVLEAVASPAARRMGTHGMRFGPLEEPAAACLPGPLAHGEAARALLPVLQGLLET